MKRTILFLTSILFVSSVALARSVTASTTIPAPADQQWAKYVIDHLDVRTFPSSLGPRRDRRKIIFADYGFEPSMLSANEAQLTTAEKDWYFTVDILRHDRNSILICLTDDANDGGTYKSSGSLTLVLAADGKHLRGEASTEQHTDCPKYP